MMIAAGSELKGKKVLIVESRFPMPFTLYRAMEELGAEIIGPVGFPEDVLLVIAGNRPDGAIVDGQIERNKREAIYRVLRRRHVPFVEASPCLTSISGHGGCFRLSDAEIELTVLGQALFP
jgi:hypothetical protein